MSVSVNVSVSVSVNCESRCKYVTIRGIARHCDVYPSDMSGSFYTFNRDEYKNIKYGDHVFVVTEALKEFNAYIVPTLRAKGIKIYLVTGCNIRGVPNEISSVDGFDYRTLLGDIVMIWYCQNYDNDTVIDRMVPIPLGVDYHTYKNTIPIDKQEEQLSTLYNTSIPYNNRINMTFSYFQFQLFDRWWRDRYVALQALQGKTYNFTPESRLPREHTWMLCSMFKYVISPHGNGLDCHRTYEAMILGAIPIVKSSPLDVIYKEMPVIILNNWSDIDSIFTRSVSMKRDALYLDYWLHKIKCNMELVPQPCTHQETSTLSLTICICCKNVSQRLDTVLDMLNKLRSDFLQVHMLFFENDSTDDTVAKLSKYVQNTSHSYLLSESDVKEVLSRRYTQVLPHHFICYGRSKLLDLARNIKSELMLVLDINDRFDATMFYQHYKYNFELWYYNQWDVTAANQLNCYYDRWALRKDEHPLAYNDYWYYIHKVNNTPIKISPHRYPIRVNSAFGGAAFYKTSTINDCCRYDVISRDSKHWECEHVRFNTCCNKRVYINPKFITSIHQENNAIEF